VEAAKRPFEASRAAGTLAHWTHTPVQQYYYSSIQENNDEVVAVAVAAAGWKWWWRCNRQRCAVNACHEHFSN
jgi:hypothetical protein